MPHSAYTPSLHHLLQFCFWQEARPRIFQEAVRNVLSARRERKNHDRTDSGVGAATLCVELFWPGGRFRWSLLLCSAVDLVARVCGMMETTYGIEQDVDDAGKYLE
jgi:hypothetical protein